MAKMNGYNVIGVLLPPMSGRAALKKLREDFNQTPAHARDAMRTCLQYGIAAKQTGTVGEFVAVYPKHVRGGIQFVIEDGTSPKKVRADRPERVARARPVRYSSGVAKDSSSAPSQTTKEPVMVARTAARKAAPAKAAPAKAAAKAPVRKAKAAPEPEPEDLELEEELEDELEDEEDEDLEDEDESDEDEDEDEEEDEEEGDEEEDEDSDEDSDEESEATDYTPYASKAITPVMEDFAEWIDAEIFVPTGTSIAEVGAEDPVRLIAIAGTVRMEFQKSDFNRTQREKRQKAAAAAKATPKPKAVAKAAPAKAAPAAKKPVAKVAAKAAPAKAARPAAKAAPAKAAPARAAAPRSTTRKKGPAPY